MLILMGKSASGKDTIVNELINKYGFKKLITYTTRPMRDGEIQDVTYHYISDEDFFKKVDNRFFAEWKKYNSTQGTWYYGTAIEDIENADKDTVIILTPQGIRDIQNLGIKNITVLYIYANNFTIQHRLEKRGDDKNEVIRRMEADVIDFKGAEKLADKIVYNNYSDKFENVIHNVLYRYGR